MNVLPNLTGERTLPDGPSKDRLAELAAFCKRFGFENGTLHVPRLRDGAHFGPYVLSTFPIAWIAYYVVNDLVSKDPVVRKGFVATGPYFWDDLVDLEGYEAMAEITHGFGLPMVGYSMPFADKIGRRALLSVTSHDDPQIWREKIARLTAEMRKPATTLFENAMRDAFRNVGEGIVALTAREADCLSLIARGKAYTDIAPILGISEHTVRSYLKTARRKLGANTLAQAVVVAERRGMILSDGQIAESGRFVLTSDEASTA